MDLLKFAKTVGKLKRLKRTGWVKNNIPDCESVAEHSFMVALLAMALAPQFKLNHLKVLKMALIHDLAEAETGDTITHIGNQVVSDPNLKAQEEKKMISIILSHLEEKDYLELFEEYEENKTPEAQFVKQIDKLEMALQALEYEKEYSIDLESFFENVRPRITSPYLKIILEEIEQKRK